jgi:hypothetical protein
MFPKTIPFLSVLSFLFGLTFSLQAHSASAEMKIYETAEEFPTNNDLRAVFLQKSERYNVSDLSNTGKPKYYIFGEGQTLEAASCDAFYELVQYMDLIEVAKANPDNGAIEFSIAGFDIRIIALSSDSTEDTGGTIINKFESRLITEIAKGDLAYICDDFDEGESNFNSNGDYLSGKSKERISQIIFSTADGYLDFTKPNSANGCSYTLEEFGIEQDTRWFRSMHLLSCE